MAKKVHTTGQKIRVWLMIVAYVIFLAFAVTLELKDQGFFESRSSAPSKVETPPPTSEELLKLVNAERAKVGVAPLVEDARLDKSAQMKSDDMVKNNYFGHVDATGKHGYAYAEEQAPGICYQTGENIFWGLASNTSLAVDKAWMNSKPHHDELLDPKNILTGFGISQNKVVEHFCKIR
jgi:uncharacterized protein YkwD